MNVLYVSHNFPPEVNALANRVFHTAQHWQRRGRSVEVLTDVPSYPEGEIYAGYRNRFLQEERGGVTVSRAPLLPLENRGSLRRLALYTSFMLSAVWHSRKLRRQPDVVIGSSPHLFTAVAAARIATRLGVPFVLEVRDLWPESVVETGALEPGNPLIRLGGALADHLYARADRVVVVTEALRSRLASAHDVSEEKIEVVTNGADLELFENAPDPAVVADLRRELDLEERFVASYLGTIGTAHGAEVLLEAAGQAGDPDLAFVVVGDGARRKELERLVRELDPASFRLLPKQPRERIPALLELSDVSIVHLRDLPLFETVLPSKVFEAMASGTPIVLGVRGECRRVVCEEVQCGVFFEPETPEALLEAVRQLREDTDARRRMAENGRRASRERFSRESLAEDYWEVLQATISEAH